MLLALGVKACPDCQKDVWNFRWMTEEIHQNLFGNYNHSLCEFYLNQRGYVFNYNSVVSGFKVKDYVN